MAEDTHETKIVISGDADGAVSAFARVKTALSGITSYLGKVRSAVSAVMRAFGIFGMAVHGIQLLVEGYKKLHDWIKRNETAAKKLQEALGKQKFDTNAAWAIKNYKALNAELAETIRLLERKQRIDSDRVARSRDLEDASTEARKQEEIAALDVTAEDYDEKKREIENRYRIKGAETATARSVEDARTAASDLRAKAEEKYREADRRQAEYDKAMKLAGEAQERSSRIAVSAEYRRGDEDAVKRHDEWTAEFEKQYDFAAKIKEEIDSARKAADELMDEAAEYAGTGIASRQRERAAKLQIESEEKRERAEQEEKQRASAQEKEKKRAEEEEKNRRAEEDKAFERQKLEKIAELDPNDRDYAERKAEIERAYAERIADLKIKRAKTDQERAVAIENRKVVVMENDISRREEAAADRKDFLGRIAASDGVSVNRLTAIGLGSGVKGRNPIEGDVKEIIRILKDQVAATRNISVPDPESVFEE